MAHAAVFTEIGLTRRPGFYIVELKAGRKRCYLLKKQEFNRKVDEALMVKSRKTEGREN